MAIKTMGACVCLIWFVLLKTRFKEKHLELVSIKRVQTSAKAVSTASGIAKGVHVPPSYLEIFSKYTSFAVLNLYVFCSVEYSACVSRPIEALPLEPDGGLPSPRHPL